MPSKRYDVYYRLKYSFQKHIVLSTDNLEKALECYCKFVYDYYYDSNIDFCCLVDNKFTTRLLYTDFLF